MSVRKFQNANPYANKLLFLKYYYQHLASNLENPRGWNSPIVSLLRQSTYMVRMGLKMRTGYSIELLFDDEFDRYIKELWQKCADSNYSDFFLKIKGDTVPHIALSVYEDVKKEEIMPLFERYKNIKEKQAVFETTSVCLFLATKVTYLNINVNRNMLNYFENVYHFFAQISDRCSKFYLPDVIVPHITIGRNESLDDAKACWQFVVDNFIPQKALVKKIGLFELTFDGKNFVEARKLDEKELL